MWKERVQHPLPVWVHVRDTPMHLKTCCIRAGTSPHAQGDTPVSQPMGTRTHSQPSRIHRQAGHLLFTQVLPAHACLSTAKPPAPTRTPPQTPHVTGSSIHHATCRPVRSEVLW